MKATELMIGDWVYRPDCEDRVTTILSHSIYGLDRLRGTICEEELKPIPLTAEILEKNGWDVEDACYANYKLPDEFSSLEFYFHESSLRKWWEGVDEWDNHNKVRDITFQCHCTYVHELQHALRLCGLAELADNLKI